MKALFLVAILSVFALTQCFIDDSAPVIDDGMINYVNSLNAGWIAGRNEFFEGMTWGEARQLMGTIPIPAPSYKVEPVNVDVKLPSDFDARKQWPNCIHAIRNQGSCGSCWAFGAAEALEDRLCIASNGLINVVLSTQQIVSCDKSNAGCNGGTLLNVWRFLENTGTPTETCQRYTSGSGSTPACKTTCDSGGAASYYFANKGTSRSVSGEENIGSAIQATGPIEGSFTVYQDFNSYKSGVYRHLTGSASGGHAIKMIGFGTDTSGTKYWICANSWGASWGMSGFFYILRGTNECGMESGACYGTAKTN